MNKQRFAAKIAAGAVSAAAVAALLVGSAHAAIPADLRCTDGTYPPCPPGVGEDWHDDYIYTYTPPPMTWYTPPPEWDMPPRLCPATNPC